MRGGKGKCTTRSTTPWTRSSSMGEGIADRVRGWVSYNIRGQDIGSLRLMGTRSDQWRRQHIRPTASRVTTPPTCSMVRPVTTSCAATAATATFCFSNLLSVANLDIIRDCSTVASNNDLIPAGPRCLHCAEPDRHAGGSGAPGPGARPCRWQLTASSTTVPAGDLFYDADGSGSAQAVVFAHLDNRATLDKCRLQRDLGGP